MEKLITDAILPAEPLPYANKILYGVLYFRKNLFSNLYHCQHSDVHTSGTLNINSITTKIVLIVI